MKRGGPGHPKTHDLATRLDVPRYAAVGILESLWHFAYVYAPRGDVGKHSNSYVAASIGWTGDADVLIAALADTRFLDRCTCHRLRVHDWPDHLDQAGRRKHEVTKLGLLECFQQTTSGRLEGGQPGAGSADTEAGRVPDSGQQPEAIRPSASSPPEARYPSVTGSVTGSVAVTGSVTGAGAVAPPADEPAPRSSGGRPPRPNPLVGDRRPDLEREWLHLVREIAAREGVNPEDVPPRWNGRAGLNPADLGDDRLLRDLDDLRKRNAAHEPAKPVQSAAAVPQAEADLFDRRADLAAEFVAWFHVTPEAGILAGQRLAGVAYGEWPRAKGLPEWVRVAVWAEAQTILARPQEPEPETAAGPHVAKLSGVMRAKGDRAVLCDLCARRADDPVHLRVAVSA